MQYVLICPAYGFSCSLIEGIAGYQIIGLHTFYFPEKIKQRGVLWRSEKNENDIRRP